MDSLTSFSVFTNWEPFSICLPTPLTQLTPATMPISVPLVARTAAPTPRTLDPRAASTAAPIDTTSTGGEGYGGAADAATTTSYRITCCASSVSTESASAAGKSNCPDRGEKVLIKEETRHNSYWDGFSRLASLGLGVSALLLAYIFLTFPEA